MFMSFYCIELMVIPSVLNIESSSSKTLPNQISVESNIGKECLINLHFLSFSDFISQFQGQIIHRKSPKIKIIKKEICFLL